MPLRNKSRQNDDTYEDQIVSKDSKNLADFSLEAGAVALGLFGLYKTGKLKPLVKSGLETISTLSNKYVIDADSTLTALRQWFAFGDAEKYSAKTLANMGHYIPEKSLFRGKTLDNVKSLGYNSINEVLANSPNKGSYIHEVLNDTIEDLFQLKKHISDNVAKGRKAETRYAKTELVRLSKELGQFTQEVFNAQPGSFSDVIQQSSKEFMNIMSTSSDDAAKSIKLNGYRPITLGDIFEPVTEEYKRTIKQKATSPIKLAQEEVDEILNIVNNPTYRVDKDGRAITMIGDWANAKNLRLDKNIMIDELGNVIDLRETKSVMAEFKKSVLGDFKIPLLDFNPLSSLFNFSDNTKNHFGILFSETIQPAITRQTGRVALGENMFVMNHKAFKQTENGLEMIADNVNLNDITNAHEYGFNRRINSLRKMSGLSYYEKELADPEKAGTINKIRQFYYDKLDMGVTDKTLKGKFDIDGKLIAPDDEKFKLSINIDENLTEAIYRGTSKFNLYNQKTVYNPANVFGTLANSSYQASDTTREMRQFRKFVATTSGIKLDGIAQEKGLFNKAQYIKDYARQFVAGGSAKTGEMGRMFNETSMSVYGLFDAVFGRLNDIAPQLGFDVGSKMNLGQYSKNIFLKRVLPIYMLTQAPDMFNALSEPFFALHKDEKGTNNKDNITKFTMRNVIKPLDLGFHKVKDVIGLTKLTKKIEEFTPGFEQINELPGLYHLGMNQTYEEREHYIEKGYDPIRKARYWSLGNTPYTGGKIIQWRPNLYRRVEADADYSASKFGSRAEYYSNTWYPNPVNPLAPVNHFILDRHHYDKKHYYDRPYLKTQKEGNNIPLIGPLYTATVGNILNPQKNMHQEYWNNGKPQELNDENVPIIDNINVQTQLQWRKDAEFYQTNKEVINAVNNTFQISQEKDGYARMKAVVAAQQSSSRPSFTTFTTAHIVPAQTTNKFSGNLIQAPTQIQVPKEQVSGGSLGLELYTTPSGSSQLVNIPDDLNLYTANSRLKNYSIKRFPEASLRVSTNNFGPVMADYDNEKIKSQFVANLGEEYNTMSDFFGMKGFETRQFIFGEANQNASIIEDSNYAYSFNKDFWDTNLGGMPGDASEIFRRFVQKRNNSMNYINPIRNTMPSWMPGRNYFTDFKHGDPYSKIPNGEERLPGEGYERLAGINVNNMFKMRIGSSYIGKSKEDMQKHLLHQDSLDSFGLDVTEEGTETHNRIEKEWMDSGLAISVEGRVEDKENNILGFYDAMIHDPTSETGKGIVDIKTVGDKKYQRILEQGHPEFEHQSQVNYYLWATGNTRSKGYIYYVNRDNPEQTMTMGFNYSNDLLRQNINTLNQARNEIYQGLENGTIGRGELYDNLDRYRILADTAPYSEEFQQIKARLSLDPNLTEEDKKEISEINERLKKQKEPIRVYPYKFKTANLQKETVKVKKVLDNNTLLVDQYGKEHAIKLAGINVFESNSEQFEDTTMTQKEAAERELRKYIRNNKYITIGYDADDANKFKNDSTKSIRAVVYANGKNVNKALIDARVATVKEDDNSPAAIRARYTNNEIGFGASMERLTHFIGNTPFIGNKMFQVKSPYEQYRSREVYGKDFQSWNNPIKDYLQPEMVDKMMAHGAKGVEGIISGTFLAGFLGSMFGANSYGKAVGALVGGSIGLFGGTYAYLQKDEKSDWRPKRRREQEEMNEYIDTLKYVKNIGLYQKYKEKALKEDHIDVDEFIGSKKAEGIQNKLKSNELKRFKKEVKLDYKHRKQFDFKYNDESLFDMSLSKEDLVSQINQQLNVIASDRSIEHVSDNIAKAFEYKTAADKTMYGYKQGDPLQNLMTALPKKEKQYFKYFVNAPEEEKAKIMRIAPSYLRRALQQSWGLEVEEKPTLQEYFQTHGLPDADWIGWDESTDIEDVKVKLVHQNKLDLGEFDIWDDQIQSANQVNIPIPQLHSQKDTRMVKSRLRRIMSDAGLEEASIITLNGYKSKNQLVINEDDRPRMSEAIKNFNF